MGNQCLLLLIELKILTIVTLLQNIVILGAHARSPEVDGIKIFDKGDQATKQSTRNNNILQWGHDDQNF